MVMIRVAKKKNSGNFPWELRLGNFGNIPSLKLTRNSCQFMGIYRNFGEFMGINWKFGEIYKTVSYTNININILFDHRLTCTQTNKNVKKNGGGGL